MWPPLLRIASVWKGVMFLCAGSRMSVSSFIPRIVGLREKKNLQPRQRGGLYMRSWCFNDVLNALNATVYRLVNEPEIRQKSTSESEFVTHFQTWNYLSQTYETVSVGDRDKLYSNLFSMFQYICAVKPAVAWCLLTPLGGRDRLKGLNKSLKPPIARDPRSF